jgi:HPt (histidine-containing phosphotransfer) domain-containing protein
LDKDAHTQQVSPETYPETGVSILDAAALNNLLSALGGDFSFLVELIDTFLEDAPNLLYDLDQFIDIQDSNGVRRVAHSLKSNGADFGGFAFSNLCKELEMMAKSGSLQGSKDIYNQIVAEYNKLEMSLKDIKQAGSIST